MGLGVSNIQNILELKNLGYLKDSDSIMEIGSQELHLNVLDLKELFEIAGLDKNVIDDFPNIDVSIIIGANDIVNPSALTDPNSPIAGMPVLECWKGKTTVVLKRGMATGYAGVQNPLFFEDNTRMLFGDAKASLDAVFKNL